MKFLKKHWIEIACTSLAGIATYLAGQKIIWCWYVWLLADVFWGWYFIKKKSWVFFVANFGWVALNIYCLLEWMK